MAPEVPPDVPQARVSGLVLAGGLARRMGGCDKALMRLGARITLLEVLLRRVAPQCGSLAISANGDPARFEAAALPVLADPPGPSRGPLAGVLAGLEHAAARDPGGWLLTVPGDTPFVPADLVARLGAAARNVGRPVARATCDGRLHALVALWSCALREPLREALLERDLRKVTAFQLMVGAVDVPWAAVPIDPFFNVNTPEDLAAARTLHEELAAAGPRGA